MHGLADPRPPLQTEERAITKHSRDEFRVSGRPAPCIKQMRVNRRKTLCP